jgi:hypothetical protein
MPTECKHCSVPKVGPLALTKYKANSSKWPNRSVPNWWKHGESVPRHLATNLTAPQRKTTLISEYA